MELDNNQGRTRDARSSLSQGPLSPLLFCLRCGRISKELPTSCSYVDDCAWTIEFNNLANKNELGSKVKTFLE
jgi:hypothetical protein